ncbi:MAG: hypothetical protein F4X36_17895 [Gammaproteobacteria bacterium]|nr:hypothetical protein [Gammaproteobacteria bacterium]
MDSEEERSELELEKLRSEIAKLEVDTRSRYQAREARASARLVQSRVGRLGWSERRNCSDEGFRLAVKEEDRMMLQRHEYLAGSIKVDRDWWIVTKLVALTVACALISAGVFWLL